jgi:sugar lactone lactonase YvrE
MPSILPISIRPSPDGNLYVLSRDALRFGATQSLFKLTPDGRVAKLADGSLQRLAVDATGNAYFDTIGTAGISKLDNSTGVVSGLTVPAVPNSVFTDATGQHISSGLINVAGTPSGPAIQTKIQAAGANSIPNGGGWAADDSFLYFVARPCVLYKMSLSTGVLTRIAGLVPQSSADDKCGTGSDNVAGTSSKITGVGGLAVLGNSLFIGGYLDTMVRHLNLNTGILSTYAGNTFAISSLGAGDGLPATSNGVRLTVLDVAVDSSGNLYIATPYGIRKVTPGNGASGGTISTFYATPRSPGGQVSPNVLMADSIAVQGGYLYATENRFSEGGISAGPLVVLELARIWKINLTTGAAAILVNGPQVPNGWTVTWPGATPPPGVPEAPSQLTVTTVASTSVGLSWVDNSTNEEGFEVQFRHGDIWTSVPRTSADATSTTVTGLLPQVMYFFRVRSFNLGGAQVSQFADGSPTGVFATTLVTPPIPAAPSGLDAVTVAGAGGSSNINLSWTDNSSDEENFVIERGTDGVNFPDTWTVEANRTSFSNTGLAASTTYHYRVRASSIAGASAPSNVDSATTALPPAPGSGAALDDMDSQDVVFSATSTPTDIAADGSGNIAWAEFAGKLVRRMSTEGVVSTFSCFAEYPYGLAMSGDSRLFVSLCSATTDRIYELVGSSLVLVAGTTRGFSGDGVAATAATFDGPRGLAVDSSGNIFVADSNNNRIRRIDATTGIITTVAGGGSDETSENIAALAAELSRPVDVAVGSDGSLYIAEFGSLQTIPRIRKVVGGQIRTLIGGGSFRPPEANDAVAPLDVYINPKHVAVDPVGNVYLASVDGGRASASLFFLGPDGSLRRIGRNATQVISLVPLSLTEPDGGAPHLLLPTPLTNGLATAAANVLYFVGNRSIEKVTITTSVAVNEPPVISSLSPSQGAAGLRIRIAGANFDPAAKVYFKSARWPDTANDPLSPVEWRLQSPVYSNSGSLIEAGVPNPTMAADIGSISLLPQSEVYVRNPDGQVGARQPFFVVPSLPNTIVADFPIYFTLDARANTTGRILGLGTNIEVLFYSGIDAEGRRLLNVHRKQGGTTATTHRAGDLVFKGTLSVHVAPFMYKVVNGGVGQLFCLLKPDGSVVMKAYTAGTSNGILEATEYAYAAYQATLRKEIDPLPKFEPEA